MYMMEKRRGRLCTKVLYPWTLVEIHTWGVGWRKKKRMRDQSAKRGEIIWRKQEAFGDVNRKTLFSRPFSVALMDPAFLFSRERWIDTAFSDSDVRHLLFFQEWASPALLKKGTSVTRKRRANCARKEPRVPADSTALAALRRQEVTTTFAGYFLASQRCWLFLWSHQGGPQNWSCCFRKCGGCIGPCTKHLQLRLKVESECMTKSPNGTISASFAGRIKRIQLQNHSDQS